MTTNPTPSPRTSIDPLVALFIRLAIPDRHQAWLDAGWSSPEIVDHVLAVVIPPINTDEEDDFGRFIDDVRFTFFATG